MKHNCTSLAITQASSARLQNSVPLSTVMLAGNFPLSTLTRSRACATVIPVIARSASKQMHSRVNWSTTVKMRNDRPSASLSLIKSMLQHWMGAVAIAMLPG